MYNHTVFPWAEKFQSELEAAVAARAGGNEGRARVCARRAAGIAAREYFSRLGETVSTRSAQDLLTRLAGDARLSDDVRKLARLLTLRVNADFDLPEGVDLIACARALAAQLSASSGGTPPPAAAVP